MYRVVKMAANAADSQKTEFDSEEEARAEFKRLGDVPKQIQQKSADGGWFVAHPRIWGRVRGRPAHLECVENHNECMDCGIDRGSCGNPHCCLG